METSHGLSGFLRARRELLKPADVGLPASERRRVEGLRREEVAMLAGISTEYYLRLEQGRDHQPSTKFLTALPARCNSTKMPPFTCVNWPDRHRVGVEARPSKVLTRPCKHL